MTRGSSELRPDDSIYGLGPGPGPILLFDRFKWDERDAVLASLGKILRSGLPSWTFGGAYLFWSQLPEGEGNGELLYCGEAVDLVQRQRQHLQGPPGGGNKFVELSVYFGSASTQVCGLALLVIPPSALPWMSPPDDLPFLEDGASKRAGQKLEGLLLRASVNSDGALPRFNDRNDASKYRHLDDEPRYWSLLRYLFDHRDATMDFVTYWIRSEEVDASRYFADLVTKCPELKPVSGP